MTDTVVAATEQPHCVFDAKDFSSGAHPVWCPGCGDYGVLASLERKIRGAMKAPALRRLAPDIEALLSAG